jgi:hypothetical protein
MRRQARPACLLTSAALARMIVNEPFGAPAFASGLGASQE